MAQGVYTVLNMAHDGSPFGSLVNEGIKPRSDPTDPIPQFTRPPDSYTASTSPPLSFAGSSLDPNIVHGHSSTFEDELPASEGFSSCYERLDLTRHRDSLSSSDSSSSDPASPIRPPLCVAPTRMVSISADTEVDADDAPWNLVAYHIPWGSAYDGYKAGTLPGPDGACIFLRSPTPIKRQRTSQACEKCRERKAKCSGTRPSCMRCQSRGHDCFYSPSPALDSHPPSFGPSPPHASRSLSDSQTERPKLKRSKVVSIKRKHSVACSETSESIDGMVSLSPVTASGLIPPSLDDNHGECTRQIRRLSTPGNEEPLSRYPVSPLDTSSSASSASSFANSFDWSSSPQMLSVFCRSRMSQTDSISGSLYVNPPPSLEEYRFPPLARSLEDAKPVPIAHPQPQALCHTSLTQMSISYPNPPVPDHCVSWDTSTWFENAEPGNLWKDLGSLTDGGLDVGMDFTQSLPDSSELLDSSRYLSPYHQEGHATPTAIYPTTDFGSPNFPAYR